MPGCFVQVEAESRVTGSLDTSLHCKLSLQNKFMVICGVNADVYIYRVSTMGKYSSVSCKPALYVCCYGLLIVEQIWKEGRCRMFPQRESY